MGGRIRATAIALAIALVGGLLALPGAVFTATPAGASTIASAGPLTSVTTSPDLNCSVNHSGDTAGEFYSNTACGTFAVIAGVLYGPASIPAGSNLGAYTAWTPVSQVGPTGTGTAADPYKIVTVVDAGATGVRFTQTDTYVVGQESFRTDVSVATTTAPPAAVPVRLYRAGDCFLQDADAGTGQVDAGSGAVSCKSPTSERIEQFLPITPGSTYMEDYYYNVWSAIAAQGAFPNTCLCDSTVDNGAGLSWGINVGVAPTVVSSVLTFSPLGLTPLTITKTADTASVPTGSADGYTITVNNPNPSAVAVTSLTDTLPTGFTFTPGSTTGTSAVPTVAGNLVTWSSPFTVPAEGSSSLHFGVTVSSAAGTYTNSVTGAAGTYTVAPTGDTAPITVTSVSPLVVSLAPATGSATVGGSTSATANVTRDGAPQAGIGVAFSVTSGPNAGGSGSGTTDAAGNATFTYTGGPTAGTDTVQALVQDGDVTRTSNTVSRTWTPAVVLSVLSVGQPGAITAGADALRTVIVTNTGSAPATGVSLALTVPAGVTLVSTTPSQGTCGAVVAGVVTCSLGTIAAGGSANVNFVLQAPATVPSGGTFATSATATSTGGGTTAPAVSTTTVSAPAPGTASGYIPPGGTLSTGTDATATDNTVTSISLPNVGPGAVVTITSIPCPAGQCTGKQVVWNQFPGYTDPTKPIKVVTLYDKTIAGWGLLQSEFVKKEGQTTFSPIPPCQPAPQWVQVKHGKTWVWELKKFISQVIDYIIGGRTGIANPSPCSDRKEQLSNGDLRYTSLFLSGDPVKRR